MSNPSLYDLDAELESLQRDLIDAQGEIDDETEKRLDAVLDAREEKIEGYYKIIRHLTTQEEAAQAEADRVQKRADAFAKKADDLRERLLASMRSFGDEEYDTPIGKIKRQVHHTRPTRLNDGVKAKDLPERFRREKTRVSADKSALAEALEAGDEEALEFAHLGDASQYLRFY